MSKFITVWCEWDIGQSDVIFKTKEDAMFWVKAQIELHCMEESYEELRKDGLVGFGDVTLWESEQ